jgi:hypothetical protein
MRADKAVTPILRQGDYPLVPDELKLLHCEDFHDDAQHAFHLEEVPDFEDQNIATHRQLR